MSKRARIGRGRASHLLLNLLFLALGWLGTSHALAATYPVPVELGQNLIANHAPTQPLNTLLTSGSGSPSDFFICRWDVASQHWVNVSLGTLSGGWTPPWVFPEGEGAACLKLTGSSAIFNVSVPGVAAAPATTLPPDHFLLLGNNITAPATYSDLLHNPSAIPAGAVGAQHTYVGRWIPASGTTAATYAWERYNSAWSPTATGPSVPTGESSFVGIFTAQPAPVLLGARLACDSVGTTLLLTFNSPVDPISASQPSSYAIPGGVTVTAARVIYPRDAGVQGGPILPYATQVELTVTGLPTTAGTLTVNANSVGSLSGATTPSSTSVFNGLMPVSHTFDCSGLLCLTFNRALDPVTAVAIANYSITLSGGAAAPTVTSVSYSAFTNSTIVCLHLTGLPPGGGTFAATVALNNLKTDCGVLLGAATTYGFTLTCDPEIKGRVFRHKTAPCSQDTATLDACSGLLQEHGLPRWTVVLTSGSAAIASALTDANGDYSMRSPSGSYTLTLYSTAGSGWTAPVGCAGLTRSVTHTTTTPSEDFPIEPTSPFTDLGIWAWISGIPAGAPCCGQDAAIFVQYFNAGTEAISSQTLTLTLPTAAFSSYIANTAFSSVPMPAPLGAGTAGAATLVWTLPALPPGSHGYVAAKIRLSCPIGSLNTLSATAGITPPTCPTADANAGNNSSTFSTLTTCAYDPNDKTVDPKGCGPWGRVLRGTEFTYRIDFQNLGSGPAQKVVICDTLDADLDLATVQYLGASHVGSLHIDPATRKLTFTFNDIYLPADMFDPPGSHGFVLFRVKHLPGVPDNTRITNSAAIYFDLNPAVLTGITTNTIVDSLTPPATFTVSPATGSAGQPVQFTYTGPPDADVVWTFAPDGTPATSTAHNPVVTYASAGTKQVSLIARYGECPTASGSLAYPVGSGDCCAGCMPPFPASLTVNVAPGYNFLVNPFCHGAANALGSILSTVPDGSQLLKWNKTTQNFDDPFNYDSGFGGWVDGNFDPAPAIPLPPGDGFIFFNPSPTSFSLTFTGCEPDCGPRCPPTNGLCLVGRTGSATNAVLWEHLFNCPPVCGSFVSIFNGSSYNTFTYLNSGWSPATPTWPAGKSVFVGWQANANCQPCPLVRAHALNSGMDSSGNLLPAGAAESRWTNVFAPGGSIPMVVINPASRPGVWVDGSTNSRWVGPSVSSVGPAGPYTNRWSFDAPCTNVCLRGRFTSDDDGYLFVNGTLVGGPSGFSAWTPVNVCTGFVHGMNTLELVVNNAGGATGFRTELEIWTECCDPCTSANLLVNGSFEDGTFNIDGDDCQILPNGSTIMPGWTVTIDQAAR